MNRIFITAFIYVLVLFTFGSCKSDRASQQGPLVDFNRTGSDVVIALRTEPDGLNPVITTSAYSRQVYEEMFQYLLDIDPYTLKLRPQLAKSRAQVEDLTSGPYAGGAAFTFEIREEAVWDDGQPVTGHDFVFSIKACLNPKVQAPRLRASLPPMKDIQVAPDNPKRLTVTVSQKDILSEEYIAAALPVLPAHIYDPENLLKDIPFTDFSNTEKIDQMAESDERLTKFAEAFNSVKYSREAANISGSGPYKFVSWETGQSLVLERKTDWWGDQVKDDNTTFFDAYPERLEFIPIANEETAVALFKAEEADALGEIGVDNFQDLQANEFAAERYKFESLLQQAQYFLYLNTNQPTLEDKRVRRALAHLVDVDGIINNFYQGNAQRLSVPVFPKASYYDQSLTPIKLDIEKAKSLLAEAGWADSNNDGTLDKEVNGERIEMALEYLYNTRSERSENVGLLIQENARKAGVKIDLVGKESNLLFQDTKTGNYDFAISGKTMSPTLWNPRQMWHTSSDAGGDNRTGFGNAETDALIEEILVTMDEEKRNDLYKKLQGIIYDEQPLIFFFVPQSNIVMHKRFDAEATPIFPGFEPSDFKLNIPAK